MPVGSDSNLSDINKSWLVNLASGMKCCHNAVAIFSQPSTTFRAEIEAFSRKKNLLDPWAEN